MASRKLRSADVKSSRQASSNLRPVRGSDGAKRPRPSSIEDLYGGGEEGNLLDGRFHTEKVYSWFQNRHAKGRKLVDEDGNFCRGDHVWKIPYGVRDALNAPLIYTQMAHRFPWFVTWVSPKTGKRLKKFFGSLPLAMEFIATKAQYVDEESSVVSRNGYDIPQKLRGKFPRMMNGKTHYWCPRCMAPRRMRRVSTGETFFAVKKEWSDEKQKYVFRDRKLALLECVVCGGTNRDAKFRRSNQPYEIRRFKPGVRRARPKKRRK